MIENQEISATGATPAGTRGRLMDRTALLITLLIVLGIGVLVTLRLLFA